MAFEVDRWSRARWFGVVTLVALVTRAPVFLHPFLSGDEATYAALANAMLDGRWLYVDAVDHKPPLIAATYAVMLGICGRYDLQAVHLISIGVVVATAVLLALLARNLGAAPGQARLSGLLYVVASATGPGPDVLAANAELFMALPSVAALALVTRSPRTSSVRSRTSEVARSLTAGAAVGAAALYKYQAAAMLAPVIVLAWRTPPVARRLARISAVLAGLAAVVAGVIAVYVLTGEFDALRFWAWTFPLTYAGALDPGSVLLNAVLRTLAWGAPNTVLLAAAWLGWARAGAGGRGALPPADQVSRTRRIVLIVWLAAAALGVAAGGRFFGHYYLQLLPPLVVLAGAGLAHLGRTVLGPRLTVGALALPLAAFWIASAADAVFRPEVTRDTAVYRHLAAELRSRGTPGDTLFVWGNSSQLYVFARMPMGTRFPFCNYQTGKMWGTPADRENAIGTEAHIVGASWPLLLEDIERRAPTWIVDAAEAGLDRWRGHPIARYPPLASLVACRYDAVTRVDGATIYRRRAASTAGPAPRAACASVDGPAPGAGLSAGR